MRCLMRLQRVALVAAAARPRRALASPCAAARRLHCAASTEAQRGGGVPSRPPGARGGGRPGGGSRGGGRPGPPAERGALPAAPRSETDEQGAAALLAAGERVGAARVVLEKGKARLFWSGNPIVFGGAVAEVKPARGKAAPATGDAVLVTDHAGAPLGWGVFNDTSMYRVRLLASAAEAALSPELALDIDATIRARVHAAAAVRSRLRLPEAGVTTTYRLLNSEGDRLSGIVADVFGEYVVVASTAAWAEQRRDAVAAALLAATGASALLWRPSPDLLRLEGVPDCAPAALFTPDGAATPLAPAWAAAEPDGGDDDADEAAAGGAPPAPPPAAGGATLPERVVVLENGVRYNVALKSGQKTGFYCDQRDSRARVRAAAAGARVLDLCCYSGGFAINAALGGALHVTGVDSSASAVALARDNAALNGLAEPRCRFVAGDALEFMRAALAAEGGAGSYDIVILDPPKLAPKRDALVKASGLYRRLNAAAAALVAPGGLLLSCTCSGAMTQSGAFPSLVADAAAAQGRSAALLAVAGAAPCHARAAGYPEGEYLTAVFMGLS